MGYIDQNKSFTIMICAFFIYSMHLCAYSSEELFILQRWMHACVLSLQSRLTLCNTWTIDHQAPLSLGFSRQEYWCGSPCPLSGDLPDPEIEPACLVSLALAGCFLYHWCHLGSTPRER